MSNVSAGNDGRVNPSKRAPTVLTVDDVAATLQVCTKTVRRWIKDGALPHLRLGRAIRVRAVDVDVFLGRRHVQTGMFSSIQLQEKNETT